MSVFGGVMLFAAGVVIGGSAVGYHKSSIREVELDACTERDELRNELVDAKFRAECDRAYRKGYRDGRRDPLTEAEKLAETFSGHRTVIRNTTKGA